MSHKVHSTLGSLAARGPLPRLRFGSRARRDRRSSNRRPLRGGVGDPPARLDHRSELRGCSCT